MIIRSATRYSNKIKFIVFLYSTVVETSKSYTCTVRNIPEIIWNILRLPKTEPYDNNFEYNIVVNLLQNKLNIHIFYTYKTKEALFEKIYGSASNDC